MSSALTFDYIVVGSGSAGAVVAARLSEDLGKRVLLLEAGGRDRNPWIHLPIGYYKTMFNPNTSWNYETEPEDTVAGRSIPWPRGKTLGGSSSINGLLYVRGQHADYDHWRQLGNAGWSWENVLPYFKKAEDQERGSDEFHGTKGPLGVADIRLHHELCEAFISAGQEAGIIRNDDFNGADQEGVGYYQMTERNGLRCSTAVAYLRDAEKRPNFKIETHALVNRVLIKNKKAIGIEYTQNGQVYKAMASGEVILSAGSIGSPQILQLSGIAAGDMLKSKGIEVVHDLEGVGKNLQDHLQVRMIYKCKRPVSINDMVRNPFKKAMIGLEFIFNRSGILTIGAGQAGGFVKIMPGADKPDMQFHFMTMSADKPGQGLHKFSAFTSTVCQLRPESRGHIEIKSSDPAEKPGLYPNYLSEEMDCNFFVEALKFGRNVAAQPSLQTYISEEFEPGINVQTDEELLAHTRKKATTVFHPVGTCKMAPESDRGSVVDERLRVRGIEQLRVIDASIMPTLTSGNTNAPAIMIGEQGADFIKADTR
jgi:choline dehydrogenase